MPAFVRKGQNVWIRQCVVGSLSLGWLNHQLDCTCFFPLKANSELLWQVNRIGCGLGENPWLEHKGRWGFGLHYERHKFMMNKEFGALRLSRNREVWGAFELAFLLHIGGWILPSLHAHCHHRIGLYFLLPFSIVSVCHLHHNCRALLMLGPHKAPHIINLSPGEWVRSMGCCRK